MKTREGKGHFEGSSQHSVNQSEEGDKILKKKVKKSKKQKYDKNADVSFSGVLQDCKFCSKFFPSVARLKEHLTEVHSDVRVANVKVEETLRQCQQCLQYFIKNDDYLKHAQQCTTETQSSILQHEAVVELNQLKCPSCNIYFSSQEMLAKHEEDTHSCHSVATCPCCSSQVRTLNPNVRSIETQTIELLDCDRCREKFENKTALDWHQLKAHRITPKTVHLKCRRPPGRPPTSKEKLTCSVCGKVFRSIAAVNSHMKRHRDTVNTPRCLDCDLTFEKDSDLRAHLEDHQTFACSECGKLFTSLLSLQAHFKWHDKDKDEGKSAGCKSWICHVCGQEYGRKSHLNTHLKRHQGIRSYSCPHCEKCFYTSHNLKIHVWTHTGERPYMCTREGCFKRFTQKSHLKYHTTTHEKKLVHEAAKEVSVIPSGGNTAESPPGFTEQVVLHCTESGSLPAKTHPQSKEHVDVAAERPPDSTEQVVLHVHRTGSGVLPAKTHPQSKEQIDIAAERLPDSTEQVVLHVHRTGSGVLPAETHPQSKEQIDIAAERPPDSTEHLVVAAECHPDSKEHVIVDQSEAEMLTVQSYNVQEVSTTPHVELQSNDKQQQGFKLQELRTREDFMKTEDTSGNQVVADIKLESAGIFITEMHSYSEQTVVSKK